MARKSDDLADSFATEDSGSWITRILAEEGELDSRAKWRLGTWAAGSVGALVIAILASQSSTQSKREQVAAADLARQSQMIQRLAKQSQSESSRLASAIETLNSDRDRLFSRLGTLEQGLDSVTGSIARVQATAPSPTADKPAAAAPSATVVKAPETPAPALPPASLAAAPSIAPVETRSVPAVVATAPAPVEADVAKPAASKTATAVVPTPSTTSVAPTETPTTKPDAGRAVTAPPAPVTSVVPAEAPAAKAAANKSIAAAVPLMPARSLMAPPDSAASKLVEAPSKPEVAAVAPAADDAETDEAEAAPIAVQRTQFGVDLGGANTIDGLRTLWNRLSKSNKLLAGLRPIIMVQERDSGNGTQLRLVAGPLDDAAAAAKLCARLGGGKRFCETAVFDGQRLPGGAPAPTPRSSRRHSPPKVTSNIPEPAPPPKPTSFSSFLGLR
ncbi:MAG: SPOR domain-containing protein [Rhodopseudomonas sp.]|nr:SPOR domain-containing protein [Rhodopseudomonas sp.]